MEFNVPVTDKKRLVIVGGGFGGLTLAQRLGKSDFQIVLIDKNNYHQFPPLLYQVATAGLEAESISFPFRKIFQKQKNIYFRLAEVTAVVAEQNRIETSIGSLAYDYLVLAAGTVTNFFGNENIIRNSLPMKSIEEGLILKNKLLTNLEKVITCTDPGERQAYMNVVVVGGGATGVEVSGALSEMKRFILPKDYPDLKAEELNLYLIEGAPKLLGALSEEASMHTERFLNGMGVKILLNKKVVDYKDDIVYLEDGDTIPTKTLIWVSGVTAVSFDKIAKEQTGRGRRLLVDEYNRVQGTPNIFAIGDICLQTEKDYPNGHPQVAQVAIQQGRLLAGNLIQLSKNKPMKAFHYRNLGSLATIGRNKAVADIHSFKLHGFTAWLVWLIVHLRSILGVKNKIFVLINWIWNYITYDLSMRFILYIPKEEEAVSSKQ